MGDTEKPITIRRSGIAIVRPRLHENTSENRDLFKRWTKLHMRDTLSLPSHPDFGRVTKVLRFKCLDSNGEEEYLYTHHLDDVRLLATGALQNVSQRLDLENTRALEEGEEPVLKKGDEREGKKPMVFSIVKPVVDVFEEVVNVLLNKNPVKSYQDLPAEIATMENAPRCTLVALTISPIDWNGNDVDLRDTEKVRKLQFDLVEFLRTATQKSVYTTMYQRNPYARPEGLSGIPEGQHGNGEWTVCVLVDGNADKDLAEVGFQGVEGQVAEWRKRMKLSGNMEGLDVKAGVWKGDVFMS